MAALKALVGTSEKSGLLPRDFLCNSYLYSSCKINRQFYYSSFFILEGPCKGKEWF